MANTLPYSTVVGAPSHIWVAPVGTAMPALDAATPAVAWVDLGETDGGLEFSPKRTTKKYTTDQSWAPKKTSVESKEITVSVTLAQVTLERLAKVLDNQTVTTIAAGAGTIGYRYIKLSAAATLPQYAMCIRVLSPYGTGDMQIELPCVSPSGDQTMSYKKSDMTTIPTEWDVLEDPADAGYFGTMRAYNAAAV